MPCIFFFSFPSSDFSRSQAPIGNAVLEALLPVTSPCPSNFDQTFIAKIIPCAGIPPMLRTVHIATLDGIVVHIVQLLPHHGFIADKLWMVALFPDLVDRFGFVWALEESQHFQDFRRAALLQIIDDGPGRVGFEAPHVTA